MLDVKKIYKSFSFIDGANALCEDEIRENYLGSGNANRKDCPKALGSTCTINKQGEGGTVTFLCKETEDSRAEWVLQGIKMLSMI